MRAFGRRKNWADDCQQIVLRSVFRHYNDPTVNTLLRVDQLREVVCMNINGIRPFLNGIEMLWTFLISPRRSHRRSRVVEVLNSSFGRYVSFLRCVIDFPIRWLIHLSSQIDTEIEQSTPGHLKKFIAK